MNNENQQFEHKRGIFLAVIIVIISLVAGVIGGGAGVILMLRNPNLQKFIGSGKNSSIINQQVVLAEESGTVDVVKKASPAVVSILIKKDVSQGNPLFTDPFSPFFGFGNSGTRTTPNIQQVGAGSGFFVSADGYILTNKHVVADEKASYTATLSDGRSFEAKVAAVDNFNDIAILKIDIKDAPTLELANSDSLQIGQKVIAIGNSLGQYQNTVTTGVVSGIGRSIVAGSFEGTEQLEGVIQTDAAINPGNSGGPLLNIAGQVIGINTAVDREGQLVGFAIPSSDVKRAFDSFTRTGKITKAYLGVRYVNITPAIVEAKKLAKDYGALLVNGENPTDGAVVSGGPADKAGLKEGDIILEINGTKIDQSNSLPKLIKGYAAGDELTLKVYSDNSEKTVKLKLEESK